MPSCVLRAGSLVLAEAVGGSLHAEYALFTLSDLRLRATFIGEVREAGYESTVGDARERLARLGITAELAELTAAPLREGLVVVYSRGKLVQEHSATLPISELLAGSVYDPLSHRYRGTYLDLPTLVDDLAVDDGPVALQAIALAAVLAELPDDMELQLDTSELAASRPVGFRSYQRVKPRDVGHLPAALYDLSQRARPDRPHAEATGPSRIQILARMRALAGASGQAAIRESLARLETGFSMRPAPPHGPLSKETTWVLELLLDEGRVTEVTIKLDAIEAEGGRTPATTYLRLRAQLIAKLEDPMAIAERIDAFAMSSTSFNELGLLAAEAWAQAEEWRRALPFAHDVLENAHSDPSLLGRARAVKNLSEQWLRVSEPPSGHARSEHAPENAQSALYTRSERPGSPRPSGRSAEGLTTGLVPRDPRSEAPAPVHEPLSERAFEQAAPPHDALALANRPSEPRGYPSPMVSGTPPAIHRHSSGRQSAAAPQAFSGASQPPQRRVTPLGLTAPNVNPHWAPVGAPITAPSPFGGQRYPSSTRVPTALGATLQPPGAAPAPAPLTDPTGNSSHPLSNGALRVSDKGRESAPPSRRATPPWTPAVRENAVSGPIGSLVKGASMPVYAAPKDVDAAQSPFDRRSQRPRAELLAELAAPLGVSLGAVDTEQAPSSPSLARAVFTKLARELGTQVRVRNGVDLRLDLAGLEFLQRTLTETIPENTIRTHEEARAVRLHGAFLSEYLARELGAHWDTLESDELGHWSMRIPPGIAVWPFGRLIRFVQMRHRERDLVSYVLELERRQRDSH